MTDAPAAAAVRVTSAAGTWHPTSLQELLLDAALDERVERANAAFDQWVRANGFDEFDAGSYRILPLVAQRADSLDACTAWSGKLRGILRRSWSENQLVYHRTLPAIDVLQRAGIDVVVFKGAALGASVYRGRGVRPMDDLDVLVTEDRAGDALRALLVEGWELGDDAVTAALWRGEVPAAFRRLRPGVSLHGPEGAGIDVHWHATHAWCWPDADRGMLATTQPLELLGRSVGMLAPADELVVTCVHGLAPNAIPPIRWVADAVLLIRHGSIGWDDLLVRAHDLQVEPFLVLAFDYLRSRFAAPVPDRVVSNLRQRRVRYLERAWFESRVAGGSHRSLAAHYGGYLRGAHTSHGFQRYAGGLPQHLVYQLGCESSADLPVEIGRRAAHRLGLRTPGGTASRDGRRPSSR